ncbi:uncharacterized protein SCO1/SenC/PrrC [Burkholderiales bacterium JOSHI_001]|nr:uncharacterized protein SCO1/SenC/PrrC [Burkholderiales bacterium JOSHI_001]
MPLLLLGRAGGAHAAGDTPPTPRGASVGAGLPAPGSYTLPRLGRAPDGEVLDHRGRAHRLHTLLGGRITVLSFMYTYCRDPEGCPLAWAAMDGLHALLAAEPALAARAQLVSLSFDPHNDTPQQMALFGGQRARLAPVRWHFLTTASVPWLLPLLNGFGQDVTVETDARGQPTRTLNHLLKLFLVDARRTVREVYGVATLSQQALHNDLRTLAMEAP